MFISKMKLLLMLLLFINSNQVSALDVLEDMWYGLCDCIHECTTHFGTPNTPEFKYLLLKQALQDVTKSNTIPIEIPFAIIVLNNKIGPLVENIAENCNGSMKLIKALERTCENCGPRLSLEIFRLGLDAKKSWVSNDHLFFITLRTALENGRREVASLLMSKYYYSNIVLLDIVNDTSILTWHSAASNGHADFISNMIYSLGDSAARLIVIKHKNGWAALHLAAFYGQAYIVELLLRGLGNKSSEVVFHSNIDGHTALHLAAKGGFIEIINMLIKAAKEKAQALFDEEDKLGFTAFFYASPEIKEMIIPTNVHRPNRTL